MSARGKQVALAETPQDLADKHDLRIHRAKQKCQQVGYQGINHFVGTICHHDGDAEMTVYLKGCADQVRPSEITILEQPT